MPPLSLGKSDQQDKCLNFRFNPLLLDCLCQRLSHSTPVNSETSLNLWGPQTSEREDNPMFCHKATSFTKTKQSRWREQHTKMPVSRTDPNTHLPGKSQQIEQREGGFQHCLASASDHLIRSVWILRDKMPHQTQTKMWEWKKMLMTSWRFLARNLLYQQLKLGGWIWGKTDVAWWWNWLLSLKERCDSSENEVWFGIRP